MPAGPLGPPVDLSVDGRCMGVGAWATFLEVNMATKSLTQGKSRGKL